MSQKSSSLTPSLSLVNQVDWHDDSDEEEEYDEEEELQKNQSAINAQKMVSESGTANQTTTSASKTTDNSSGVKDAEETPTPTGQASDQRDTQGSQFDKGGQEEEKREYGD